MPTTALPFVLLATATALAQAPTFAPPVRLEAGAKLLGAGRLYPSPVYHDLDGDQVPDIVVGDLRGHLTVALRVGESRGVAGAPRTAPLFGKEEKVLGADGKILDLQNW